jgi:hypothetical protein
MKHFGLIILIYGLTLNSSIHHKLKTDKPQIQSEGLDSTEVSKNKEAIQKLIRQVLIWGSSKESIDLLPTLSDSMNRVYIGFDLDKLKENLDKLKQTGFFASEFIENYNQLIRTLDRKIRNKEFEDWQVGDMPIFNFVNDINPWCLCQGFSTEQFGDIKIIKLDNKTGEFIWKWTIDADWMDFKFRVLKEDNKWKISYLEGFDYNDITK